MNKSQQTKNLLQSQHLKSKETFLGAKLLKTVPPVKHGGGGIMGLSFSATDAESKLRYVKGGLAHNSSAAA